MEQEDSSNCFIVTTDIYVYCFMSHKEIFYRRIHRIMSLKGENPFQLPTSINNDTILYTCVAEERYQHLFLTK